MDEKRYDGVEELRQLTYKDEEAFKVYIQEWYDNDEKVVPGNTNLKEYQSFKAMVDELNQEKPSEGGVPSTTLFYFVDGNIVGAVDIRHELNHRLNIGGHIGYGVASSYRGKGYASILLGQALNYLKSLNVETVLMTTNPFNYASQNVIKSTVAMKSNPILKRMGKSLIDIKF